LQLTVAPSILPLGASCDENYGQCRTNLDALGDATRRRVFKRLRSGSRSVQAIADGLDVSRPAVSQHLKVLKAAGLVIVRVEGTRRLYTVNARGVEALRSWLDGFWHETLAALKEAAESEAAKASKRE
jgi:DNA-binding transcriptional ArsR family regulator